MTSLNLFADEVLTITRSVRKRLDFEKPVPQHVLLECLELAIRAPGDLDSNVDRTGVPLAAVAMIVATVRIRWSGSSPTPTASPLGWSPWERRSMSAGARGSGRRRRAVQG